VALLGTILIRAILVHGIEVGHRRLLAQILNTHACIGTVK
jgi:hypothetical protein